MKETMEISFCVMPVDFIVQNRVLENYEKNNNNNKIMSTNCKDFVCSLHKIDDYESQKVVYATCVLSAIKYTMLFPVQFNS